MTVLKCGKYAVLHWVGVYGCGCIEPAFTSRSMETGDSSLCPSSEMDIVDALTVRRNCAVRDCFCSSRMSVEVVRWSSASPVSCEV